MAGFLFKLETPDGRPAEPSSLSSAVPNWGPGETIHFGHKMLRVVALRRDDADSPPVLVVEDVAERATSAALYHHVGSIGAGSWEAS